MNRGPIIREEDFQRGQYLSMYLSMYLSTLSYTLPRTINDLEKTTICIISTF